jgi:hypothetical protein
MRGGIALLPTDKLTERERTAIAAVLGSWQERSRSKEPIDVKNAERAALAVYRMGGLGPPRIVMSRNPVSAAMAATELGVMASDLQTRNFHDKAHDVLHGASHRWNIDFKSLSDSGEPLQYHRWEELETLGARLGSRPWHHRPPFSGLTWRIDNALRAELRRAYEAGRQAFNLGAFLKGATHPIIPALIDIAIDVLKLPDVEPLRPLADLARFGGYVLPARDVCWICERPSLISTDADGRLHAQDGPALDWRGSLPIYMWHGDEVPAHVMAPVDSLTKRAISRESDLALRDIMIERVGIDRYIALAGARLAHEDETGRLWVKPNPFRNRRWCAVEVVNGSPEPDGSFRRYYLRVPPFIRRAREGVAWTYGLGEEDYRLAVRT